MNLPIELPQSWLDFLDGFSVLTLLINGAAAGAILWALWRLAKRVWPGLLTFIAFVNALAVLPEFMQRTGRFMDTSARVHASLELKLDEVRHEVLPNNGGSLRDAVDEARARVEATEAHEKKDLQRITALEAEISSRTAARIAAHPRTGELPEAPPFPTDPSEE